MSAFICYIILVFPQTFSLKIASSVQKIPSSHSGLLNDDFMRISLTTEANDESIYRHILLVEMVPMPTVLYIVQCVLILCTV